MGVSLQAYRVRIGTFQPKYSIRTNKTYQENNVLIDFKTFLLVFLLSCSLPVFVHLNQDSFNITPAPIQYPTQNAIDPSNLAYNSHRFCGITPTPCSPGTSPPWPGPATQCPSHPYPRAEPWPPPFPYLPSTIPFKLEVQHSFRVQSSPGSTIILANNEAEKH
jgi:hypothetical protein